MTWPYRCGLALEMLSQLAAEKDFRGAAFLPVECCLAVLQSQQNCEKVAFIVAATGMICDALRYLGLMALAHGVANEVAVLGGP